MYKRQVYLRPIPPALSDAALRKSVIRSIVYSLPSSHSSERGVILPSVSKLAVTFTDVYKRQV